MGDERTTEGHPQPSRTARADRPITADNRQLDFVAFGVVALVITAFWLPTLTSGDRLNPNEDFFLQASRYEAVRKSLLEHRTFPLRSHWFGGGFPTLGEPEDPALNPLVLLSVLFGSVMGLKLIGFLAALASGLGTYALGRYVLGYTRWGALFSALIVGTSLFVPGHMWGGNPCETCAAYLPLCMLLIALSCRGRRAALFVLPLLLYTMLSSGKQAFFMAVLYLGVLCLLDALPMFSTLTPDAPARMFDVRALKVLVLVLGVAFFVGMVRILPALEFINARGGLTHMELYTHAKMADVSSPDFREFVEYAFGIRDQPSFVTIGWLPILLFGVASCCFWKRSLPWVITLVLCTWLVLADKAPLDLFGVLQGLPIFGTIANPRKYFSFQIVLSIGLGAGQFFWLLRKLRRPWLEHVCAVALIVAGMSFLYPRTTHGQRQTYRLEMPSDALKQQEFFNVQGLNLPRNRAWPPRSLAYVNLRENVGTIDWYVAITLPENAVPKYFVDARNRLIPNPAYRGEAFFVTEAGASGETPSSVAEPTFRPNSIIVEVTVPKPGVLVINQNYHAAWRTDRGELFDGKGLIALRLWETGSYTIHLRYLPRSFVAGLAVSVLSLAGWVLACWTFGRRRRGS